MVNVNKNSAYDVLQGLVEQSFSKNLRNMPEEFNKKQQMALDLFKQRIFLDEVIEESIAFNKSLNWENEKKLNVGLTTTAEEMINVFKLRSDIYTFIDYQKEFPDTITGLNFDRYDKNSAIIFYKENNIVRGTCRLIFDSIGELPTELKASFNKHRENHEICELSRLMISHEKGGLGLEFKNLASAVYNIYKFNDVDLILSGIRKDHFRLYKKFGGFKIEKEMDGYGKLKIPFIITSWDPSQISPFFKRAFLNIK